MAPCLRLRERPRLRRLPTGLALVAGMLVGACAPAPVEPAAPVTPAAPVEPPANVNIYDDGVATFSQVFFCPVERIVVAPSAPAAPPPDIAADPQRLALWQASHGETSHFVVEGCGKRLTYKCQFQPGRGGRQESWCMPAMDRSPVEGPAYANPDPAALDKLRRDLAADVAAMAELNAVTRRLPPGMHVMGVHVGRDPRGLRVGSVDPGGPADGKLAPGDVIVAAEGVAVASFAELWAIEKTHLGRLLVLTVGRGGALIRVVVRLNG